MVTRKVFSEGRFKQFFLQNRIPKDMSLKQRKKQKENIYPQKGII